MTCEKCRHQPECFEQRGRCTLFETEKQYRKRIRNEIEMLNKTETAGCAHDGDEDSPQRQDTGVWGVHLRDTGPCVADRAADPAET